MQTAPDRSVIKQFIIKQFMKGNDIDSVIKYFQKETTSYEWIIVTPGSKGYELIKNLEQNEKINAFFVYCWNTELYEKWTYEIKKVKCLTSSAGILCKNFIKINKEYIFPKFKYDNNGINNMNNDFNLLFDLSKL